MAAPKVAFVNLGCRVNRVELDGIAAELMRAGCEVVSSEDADAIVVNTCAVTGEAEAKTRKALRHASALPQLPQVFATGCVANLFGEEIEGLAPNVCVVADKSQVATRLLSSLGMHEGALDDCGNLVGTPTGRCRPGIKIQDGCDNRCSYCIVWKARGKSRSVRLSSVLSSVEDAVAHGAREVVLTGINLGRYHADGLGLPGLLDAIMDHTSVERVRLSSIEPPDVGPELLDAMARHGERIAPFLHICLQSGCDDTLRRMHRVYDSASFARRVHAAREALPGIAIGTDLIVGFPGETDGEFEESRAFCQQMRFAKMHIFRYSRRPGTPAAEAPDQVEPRVMAERSRRLHALAQQMRHDCAAECVGRDELVVVQAAGAGVTGGLFDVRVSSSLPVDSLVRLRPRAVLEDGTLLVPDGMAGA